MNILKKNIKLLILFIIIFLLLMFLLSGIYYIFTFNKSIYYGILFLTTLLLIYVFNLKIGKTKKNEIIPNNLIFSACIIIVIFMINMIFYIKNFSFQNILYYLIILITSILGILIGKSKKDTN